MVETKLHKIVKKKGTQVYQESGGIENGIFGQNDFTNNYDNSYILYNFGVECKILLKVNLCP